MSERIRVFCVDDHEATTTLYRLAFEAESDIELVGSRRTTRGLLEALQDARPSVLLLDLLIPGCDPLATLPSIRVRFPDLAVLVASGFEDSDMLDEAFRLGARGFFRKGMDFSELTALVRRAAAGEQPSGVPATAHSLGRSRPGEARPKT